MNSLASSNQEPSWGICFVGIGKIVNVASFAAAIAAGAEPIAAVDPLGKYALAAPRFAGKPIFKTLEELLEALAREKLPHPAGRLVFYIAVGSSHNAAIAALLVARGCNVIIEKPPGSVGDIERLDAVLQTPGAGRCYGLFHSAESPGLHPIRRWLDDSGLEKLRAVHVKWCECFPRLHAPERNRNLHFMDLARNGRGAFIRESLFNAVSVVVSLLAPHGFEFLLDRDTATFDVPKNWAAAHGTDAAPIAGEVTVNACGAGKRNIPVIFSFSGRHEVEKDGTRVGKETCWNITFDTGNPGTSLFTKWSGLETFCGGKQIYKHSPGNYTNGSSYIEYRILCDEYSIGFQNAKNALFKKQNGITFNTQANRGHSYFGKRVGGSKVQACAVP